MSAPGVSGEQLLRALIAQLQAALQTAQAILGGIEPPQPEPGPASVMGQPEEDDGSISVP